MERYCRPILGWSSRRRACAGRSGRTTAEFETGAGRSARRLDPLARRFGPGRGGRAEDMDPTACPFQGGLIGFLGYDLAPLPRTPATQGPGAIRACPTSGWPCTTRPSPSTITDGAGIPARLGPDRRGARGHRAAVPVLAAGTAVGDRVSPAGPISTLGRPASNFDRPDLSGVACRRALDYIAAGDVFQVNLSQRFSARGRDRAARPVPPAREAQPRRRSRRSSAGATWRSSRPARNGSTRRGATGS